MTTQLTPQPVRASSAPDAWHALPLEEVAVIWSTSLDAGLPQEEAAVRLRQFGPNEVTARRGRPAWLRFLLQFHQPLLYVLLAASAVTVGLGEYVDAAVIFGVVFVNAVVGFIQENRAENAIESLAGMVMTEATVRRDGRKRWVPSREIVPGDVVLLQSGDRVPADLRLVWQRRLQIDESALTGESVPVQKTVGLLAADLLLADRTNMAFAGTLVAGGLGEGIVVATGDRTETGRIAALMGSTQKLETPLTRKLAHFSRLLLFVILGMSAMAFGVGVALGQPAGLMFLSAVALAVAAIPEGLPAAVTIVLVVGVARMARRRAVIRKLPAVEALGSTTVICSDKTGTLTQNQMTVLEIHSGGAHYEVTGIGYAAAGEVRQNDRSVVLTDNAALHETLLAGLLCNDAHISLENGSYAVQGDPTEAALLVAAHKAGLSSTEALRYPRRDAIPFESELKYMATLHDDPGSQRRVIYLKGAVETVLERCADALDSDGRLVPLQRDMVLKASARMSASGLRVLAFARRWVAEGRAALSHDDVAGGLTFLGLQGMLDPPRPEAVAAVRRCQEAGIAVKMITGDHVLTAQAIARQLGLKGDPSRGEDPSHAAAASVDGTTDEPLALSGMDLAALSTEQLPDLSERAAVFARVAPEQKLQIVKALQSRGHITAMTGDGVNDAPALKQADIGVAMGRSGTDVAREAADMVLTDDNFASIEAAVEEGRSAFDNLTKFIIWTIPTNAGEALALLAAILFALSELPVLPLQILWINMVTALLLGLMLVFEPKEPDLMRRPPRPPAAPIITPVLLVRTVVVALMMLAGAFGLFLWEQGRGTPIAAARTTVVNVIVLVEIFYLFNCRSLTRSAWSLGFASNPLLLSGVVAMLLAQLAFTYLPIFNRLFQSAPIGWDSWLTAFGAGLVAYVVIEAEKGLRLRAERARRSSHAG